MKWRYLKNGLVYLLICMFLMMVVLNVIIATGDGPWQKTDATVTETEVQSVRWGKPVWALQASFTYNVNGERFDGELYVFNDDKYEVTESQQQLWPAGRVFNIYTKPAQPTSYSLAEDGDREAMAVVVCLAIPALVAFSWIAWEVVKRKQAERLAMKGNARTV